MARSGEHPRRTLRLGVESGTTGILHNPLPLGAMVAVHTLWF